MRKLALPEEVLLQIEQPARYIGNEFNSVVKDKEKVALRGAFLFPDVYERPALFFYRNCAGRPPQASL